MAASSALERLLLDAGLDARSAKWLPWLLDNVRDFPEGSDGLAGGLLRWRRREAVESYGCGVAEALEALRPLLPRDNLPDAERVARLCLTRFEEGQIPPGWDTEREE